MVLHVHLEAANLTITEAISFYYGHFYLIDWQPPKLTKPNPPKTVISTQSAKQYVILYAHNQRLRHVEPSTMEIQNLHATILNLIRPQTISVTPQNG